MLTLRRAEPDDSKTLWLWRNDPATRSASLNTDPVAWEDHELWFRAAMSDRTRAILIALNHAGDPVGMVRFDFDTLESATLSINIAPAQRCAGVGRALLHAALEWLRANAPEAAVTALVRFNNTASLRIFEHEEFVVSSRVDDFFTLTRPRKAPQP